MGQQIRFPSLYFERTSELLRRSKCHQIFIFLLAQPTKLLMSVSLDPALIFLLDKKLLRAA
jgi:hypothetical protein